MKKITFGLAAFIIMATSWQVFYTFTKRVIVHETNDPNSAVCYDGPSRDYDGSCVSPVAPGLDYLIRDNR